VFSNAFLAFTTPVCKSARTFVVPPGVRETLLFGEGGGGCRDDEDVSPGSRVVSFGGGREFDPVPSSARARALPVSI